MNQLKDKFEKDLKTKLLLKSSGNAPEEVILLKAFKYYDERQQNVCDINQFNQALAKVGLFGFSDEDLSQLFNYYSGGHKILNYKEFIGTVFNNPSLKQPTETESQQNDEEGEEEDPVEGIILKLRGKLADGGIQNLMSIESGFRALDPENEQVFDYNKFAKACSNFNFDLSEDELKELFAAFNREENEKLNYDELIRVLRGELSDNRKELVRNLFSKIDEEKKGSLSLDELFKIYIPKGSYEYIYKKMNEKDAMKVFVDTLKVNHLYLNGEDEFNKPVDVDEFEDYYESVSLMISDDDVFKEVLLKSWGLAPIEEEKTQKEEDKTPLVSNEVQEPPKEEINEEKVEKDNQKENIPEQKEEVPPAEENKMNEEVNNEVNEEVNNEVNEDVNKGNNEVSEVNNEANNEVSEVNNELNNEVSKANNEMNNEVEPEKVEENKPSDENIEKFREILGGRGIYNVINFMNQLRQYDRKGNKELTYNDFSDALYNSNLNISEEDIKKLFNDFVQKNNTINYSEFLSTVVGNLNPRRNNIVIEAFKRLDVENCGVVNLSDVKQLFTSKNCPLVREGMTSEEEFYNTFMETFQTHHNIFRSAKIKKVNFDEFLDYYKYVSLAIEDDYLFEDMIITAWKISKPKLNDIGRKDNIKDLFHGNIPETEAAGKNISLAGKDSRTAKKCFPQATGYVPYGVQEEATDYSNLLHPKGDLNGIRLNKRDEPLLVFRKKIAARGPRGIMSLRRTFMLYDENKNNKLSSEEFHKYVMDYRVDITQDEEYKLFKSFDKNQSGDIDYKEFIDTLVGDLNSYRYRIVEKVFEKLDKDKKGKISFDSVREGYNPCKHPEVLNGSRNADEVLGRFIDFFEYHFGLLNPSRESEEITKEEFAEFYKFISLLIEDDKYFENLMARVWGLGNTENYGKIQKNVKKKGIL